MADRNAESHFGHVETTDVKRSIFPLLFRNISTCNAGIIVPFLAYADILPGDTFKANTSVVVRMQTPLNPTMDDIFVDTYYFAIPHRLVWDHWKEFYGENKDSAWTTSTEYEVPQITAPSGGVTKGTIADYMGIPKGIAGIKYQALPFRAYCLVYDTWFRNQNLIAPVTLHTDDTDRTSDNVTTELGGLPFKAGRIPDYFSTCLPETQKPLPGFTGAMTIPLGTSAPVYTGNENTTPITKNPIYFKTTNASAGTNDNLSSGKYHAIFDSDGSTYTRLTASANQPSSTNQVLLYPTNLYADLTNATAATINALRLSFQIQKLFEARGRNGSRYFECLKGEFGVSPNLGYLQYPEYLGGKRQPLSMTQTVQTSSTDATSPLGYTGAMSHTAWSNDDFTKSFQENTILLGLMIIRQYHFYDQGLQRMWSRRQKLDYYTPVLAHLGEQPVYKKEIWATGTSTDDNVFGYQERWGEYKYGHETATGEMNTAYAQSLDIWHYGDKYASQPTLAQNWFEESADYIDRTLAVSKSVADQFKFDIVTNITATRPMPVYCTPGLIDHF